MGMLAQMDWSQWLLAVLMIAVCCFLMLVIMLQRGRGGGLTGAFGGAGGSSAFGAKTGDVFTWITVVVAVFFVVLSVLTNYAMDESEPPRSARGSTSAPDPTTPGPVDAPVPGSLPGATEFGEVVLPIGEGTPAGGQVGVVEPAVAPSTGTDAGDESDGRADEAPTDETADDETDSAPGRVPPGQ